MPAIRRRYHYGNLILSPDHALTDNALCGKTVDLITDNESIQRVEFAGFCNLSNYNDFSLFTNIVGYHHGDYPFIGQWIDYALDTVTIGVIVSGKALIGINNNRLCCLNHYTPRVRASVNNNVTSIFNRN
jgi:hypothetical protein